MLSPLKCELHNTDILCSRGMAVYDSSVTLGIKLTQSKERKAAKKEEASSYIQTQTHWTWE